MRSEHHQLLNLLLNWQREMELLLITIDDEVLEHDYLGIDRRISKMVEVCCTSE